MATKQNQHDYKLRLTGAGISVERPVSESTARRIIDLVMGGAGSAEESKKEPEAQAEGHIDTSTPKAFMTGKRPQTDLERVTCLAFYLTHNRNTPAFKTKELRALNTEAAQQKLSNPSSTARNAVTQGYLSLAGGARKQITARGEALVNALPDREKLQAAMAEHPIRKPRKRKKPKKAK